MSDESIADYYREGAWCDEAAEQAAKMDAARNNVDQRLERLEKMVQNGHDEREHDRAYINILKRQRDLLARAASDKPEFFSPIVAGYAKELARKVVEGIEPHDPMDPKHCMCDKCEEKRIKLEKSGWGGIS